MEQIYTNSVEFGRFYAWLMFLVAIVIGVVLMWFSWSIKSYNNKYSLSTKAVVKDAACEAINKDTFDCNVDVVYSVDGTDYSVDDMQVSAPISYKAGDKVSLRYNSSNPRQVVPASELVSGGWSNALAVAAILIVVIAGFRLYLAKNFRFAAAGSGISGLITAFRA